MRKKFQSKGEIFWSILSAFIKAVQLFGKHFINYRKCKNAYAKTSIFAFSRFTVRMRKMTFKRGNSLINNDCVYHNGTVFKKKFLNFTKMQKRLGKNLDFCSYLSNLLENEEKLRSNVEIFYQYFWDT